MGNVESFVDDSGHWACILDGLDGMYICCLVAWARAVA